MAAAACVGYGLHTARQTVLFSGCCYIHVREMGCIERDRQTDRESHLLAAVVHVGNCCRDRNSLICWPLLPCRGNKLKRQTENERQTHRECPICWLPHHPCGGNWLHNEIESHLMAAAKHGKLVA